jgi:multidrug efflux pump
MSAVVMSIAGVLVMLLITFKTFSVTMCGLGLISITGIVVSNNIIFIDTYQELINKHKMKIRDAIIQTANSRLRPILMTSLTSIAGLIPMIFNINVDLLNFDILLNTPSGQMWEALSATIAGGLIVSTILTLTFTPAMLMLKSPLDEVD